MGYLSTNAECSEKFKLTITEIDCLHFMFQQYSKTPLIRTLVIRMIGLALRVNSGEFYKTNLPSNYWLSVQVQYSVMAYRASNQAWSKGLDAGTYCK